MKKSKIAVGCAVLGVIMASLMGSSSASAGVNKKPCSSSQNVSGTSYNTGAYSSKPSATACGNVGARAYYQLYSGSPIYYAGWSYGTYGAASRPGNIIRGGNHTVTSPASGYSGNFPFGS